MNSKNRQGWWTDDRIEKLRAMWREGFTSGEVAAALGDGATRLSVLGKVDRLGLEKRGKGTLTPGAMARRQLASIKPAAPAKPAIDRPNRRERPDAWDALAGASPKPLVSLDAHDCHWPLGDEPPFLFCAAPALHGKTYCQIHQTMSEGPGTVSERNAMAIKGKVLA